MVNALETETAHFDKLGAKLSKREKAILRDLIDYATSITTHKQRIDPAWPAWRKQIHWAELDPAIAKLQERIKAITGHYCTF